MFDASEERNRLRLVEALATPVDEVSPAVPQVSEKVSPVLEGATDGMDGKVVSHVAPEK